MNKHEAWDATSGTWCNPMRNAPYVPPPAEKQLPPVKSNYRSLLDLWRSSGVGVDIDARKRTAALVGVKL